MSRSMPRNIPSIDVLPVAWGAVLTQHGQQRVDQVVISPDHIGPVLSNLLEWARRYAPETYSTVIQASLNPAHMAP